MLSKARCAERFYTTTAARHTPRTNMTTYKPPAYPTDPATQIQWWTSLREHFAAKCRAARISGNHPADFGLWEAEVRRADMEIARIRFQ
jgi:hypothetical protein